jgi:hypothetical protein
MAKPSESILGLFSTESIMLFRTVDWSAMGLTFAMIGATLDLPGVGKISDESESLPEKIKNGFLAGSNLEA